jgi:flavin reductase ActVB
MTDHPDVPAADAMLRRAFRQATARIVGAVAILTTTDEGGSDWGFTITAFTALSVEPPLMLVCLAREAGSFPAFESAARFALSILRDDQEELAQRFATGRPDKFILGGLSRSPTGLPMVGHALAVIECRTADRVPGGDHLIVVGHVERAEQPSAGRPLAYYRGEYVTIDAR